MLIEGKKTLVFQPFQPVTEAPKSPNKRSANEQTKSPGTISHDLRACSFSSIDTTDGKYLCKKSRHYGLSLSTKQGYRKVYFLSFEHLQIGIDFLVCQGQRFASRSAQYKIVGDYPDPVMDNKMIVVHRVTKQCLLMKFIGHDAPIETKVQAKSELLALQKTSQWEKTINLIDYFTDEEGNSHIITKLPKLTLSRHIAEIQENQGI